MQVAQHIAFPPGLASIEVLTDRGLRVVVEELPNSGGNDRFELVWEVVAGFLVRGDPFANDGPRSETLVQLGSATPFLKMIRAATHADPLYVAAMHGAPPAPGDLSHWQITTTDATIDVAATTRPTMHRLTSTG
jgi:hypothetical protein